MTCCSLSEWTLDAREEPMIRIGVVLPEDRMNSILVRIPEGPFEVSSGRGQAEAVCSVKGKVAVEARQVVFFSERGMIGPAERIRVRAQRNWQPEVGAGVQLRGVRTGRGFHWEKRISPTFTGILEFSVCQGFLLVVNELPVEDYLPSVLAGEMSGDCPLEFLKSQCLVARSWVLAHTEDKHPGMPIDRCNDDCCQRHLGTNDLTPRALEAVRLTRGQVLVDERGRLIDANYSKNCGGIIETPENVWSVAKAGQRAAVDAPPGSQVHRFFPLTADKLDEYLTGSWLQETDVFCSPHVVPEEALPWYLNKVDEGGGHFRWKVEYDREELETILRKKYFGRQDPARTAPLQTLTDLRVTLRGESGRATDLEIEYLGPAGATHVVHVQSEYAIREVLHAKFLFSSAFAIDIQRDATRVPKRVTFIGAGWGHGAGMCQIGALGMALKGHDCASIVKHYFEGVEIRACY